MTYHGHIQNGQVVFNEPVALPEGAAVRVDLLEDAAADAGAIDSQDRLNQLRKRVSSLPVENPDDGFSNRDHNQVLYGD